MTEQQALDNAQAKLQAKLTFTPADIITAILEAVISLLQKFPCPTPTPTPPALQQTAKDGLAACSAGLLTPERLRLRAAIRRHTGVVGLQKMFAYEHAVWQVGAEAPEADVAAYSQVWTSSPEGESS